MALPRNGDEQRLQDSLQAQRVRDSLHWLAESQEIRASNAELLRLAALLVFSAPGHQIIVLDREARAHPPAGRGRLILEIEVDRRNRRTIYRARQAGPTNDPSSVVVPGE